MRKNTCPFESRFSYEGKRNDTVNMGRYLSGSFKNVYLKFLKTTEVSHRTSGKYNNVEEIKGYLPPWNPRIAAPLTVYGQLWSWRSLSHTRPWGEEAARREELRGDRCNYPCASPGPQGLETPGSCPLLPSFPGSAQYH